MAVHFFGFANFWLVKLAKISLANSTFPKLGLTGPDLKKLRAPLFEPLQAVADLEAHMGKFVLASPNTRTDW